MSMRRMLLLALLVLPALLVAAAPAAAAAAGKRVYAVDPLTQKLKFKPAKLSFREVEMTELRWRRWGTKVARARGISRILTCDPDCATGGAETTATTVRLSRIRSRNGKRRYTCMSWQDDEKVTDLPDHGSLNPSTLSPCRPPATTAAARCRGIDIGFTTAAMTAQRMRCRRARFVILEWKRKVSDSDGPPPRIVQALGFRCCFGGDEGLAKLRCTRGEKVARATWGD
jgi:hypothetical protein